MAAIIRAVKGKPTSMKQMSSSGSGNDHHRHHGSIFPKIPFLRGRHKKLGEGWGVNKEPVADGVTFYLKFLGSTLVEELNDDGQSYGEGISSEAVKRVVTMARNRGAKLQKVSLYVSPSGIKMFDLVSNQLIRELTVDRIRFCTADSCHEKVFAFIARNTENETMECSAYLCAKKKMAQAVTLSVAQAFQLAYEKWEENKGIKDSQHSEKRRFSGLQGNHSADNDLFEPKPSKNTTTLDINSELPPPLMSFNSGPSEPPMRIPAPNGNHGNSTAVTQLIQPIPVLTSPRNNHQNGYKTTTTTSTTTNTTNCRQNWVSFDDNDFGPVSSQPKPQIESQNPFYFGTNLTTDDIDDGVHQFLDGSKSREEFSRQKSLEDLLDL
ncbi:uncharacterized protein LOC141914921 [Tubulanus polymorphus]|uniref:uncharacterized protein LOC141914921 n=1 Tax=Tubulanus polymorphus TaxID=672921 RepID=UPI003DA32DAB